MKQKSLKRKLWWFQSKKKRLVPKIIFQSQHYSHASCFSHSAHWFSLWDVDQHQPISHSNCSWNNNSSLLWHSSVTDLSLSWYGIDAIALQWFVSYLSSRKQKVKLMDCSSSPAEVTCWVPRGSVLGPLLFTLCITHLSFVFQIQNVKHHIYADDTMTSLPLKKSDKN